MICSTGSEGRSVEMPRGALIGRRRLRWSYVQLRRSRVRNVRGRRLRPRLPYISKCNTLVWSLITPEFPINPLTLLHPSLRASYTPPQSQSKSSFQNGKPRSQKPCQLFNQRLAKRYDERMRAMHCAKDLRKDIGPFDCLSNSLGERSAPSVTHWYVRQFIARVSEGGATSD
jgi:hypothetical protein